MSPSADKGKIRIGITQAEGDLRLMLSVTSESKHDLHEISVAEARALSLELIKQAYEAELRSRLRDRKQTQAVTFLLRHQAEY
jgi:hypothetical protein